MKPFENIEEIIKFAIDSEQEAYDFYTSLAHKTSSIQMKDIFLGYALEEAGHKKKLESIQQSRQFVAQSEKIQNLKIADYIVEIEPGPDMTYQEALIVAMKKEKAAFKLYSDLADLSTDNLLKSLFHTLAQEEAKHKLRFELEYDDIILKDN